MTELKHSLVACEMPEEDFVYLADNVEKVLHEKEEYIADLEAQIAYWRRIAHMELN